MPGPRVRLDADDRRDQILIAAQRLFAERAYDTVSTSDLAAAAGTTRTNLHYYFGTKRGLYLDVLRRFGRLPPPPAANRATGAEEVDRLFTRWLDVVEQNRETSISVIGAAGTHADPDIEQVLRDGLRAWEERLLAVLALPDTRVNRARIRAFQGLVTSAMDEWLRRGTLTKADVHSLLTRTLLSLT